MGNYYTDKTTIMTTNNPQSTKSYHGPKEGSQYTPMASDKTGNSNSG